ncbi:hypothetical protein COCVIDRAFT_83086 [Bipolaris victoriae FI3]|uniref:Uncharacterized protein n=1 Tax=Bipolaris victoriae (strain FI3) TaxID=930091 RepID=W7ERQ3_BIPV3|nr:hypothetical protein COCVIDRAFT_83086 [Bipolaris victoriae FI3]
MTRRKPCRTCRLFVQRAESETPAARHVAIRAAGHVLSGAVPEVTMPSFRRQCSRY